MAKGILGVLAGLVMWIVVALGVGMVLRLWPEYVRVASAMAFTLPMLIARLSIGAAATIAAGLVAALVTRRPTTALVTGLLLLVVFIPDHIHLWPKFPVWYHLTFLLSLLPLTYLGGTIPRRQRRVAA